MRLIQYMISGLAAAGSLLHAGEPQLLDEPFLARLRAESARAHPAAAAGQHMAAAATRDIAAVRLWDDPMVGTGFMFANRMMRAEQGDIMLGVEQALPKPGLYAARLDQARAMHRAAVENSRASGLGAGAETAKAAIELALADETVALEQAQVDWLAAMAENASGKASEPGGSGGDTLRIETELARERQTLDAARRSREGYAGKLNVVLGRPLDSPWPQLKLPRKTPPVPLAVAEIARISRTNPTVLAMRQTAAAASAETRATDRERLPVVSVGVDGKLDSVTRENGSATVGIKLTLPWFNDTSYQARTDAAKAREAAANDAVEMARREVAARVLAASTDAANAAAQARALSHEIHDKALQAKQSVEAAWISSKAPLTDLFDASRTLFAIRLEQRRMTAAQLAALEELHVLVPTR